MDNIKFRFEARIIQYDYRIGRYECVDLVDSEWGK